MVIPVRQGPISSPLFGVANSSLPDVGDHSPRSEPVLDVDQIQGNILPGFLKDFQEFIFLQIDDIAQCKKWLKSSIPFIATMEEVLAFNRLFKAIRYRRGRESNAVKATWVNIAFSAQALRRLVQGKKVDPVGAFADEAFKSGLAAQSRGLGDPNDLSAEGDPRNWLVGGPRNTADIIILIASDDQEDLTTQIEQIEDSIYTFRPVDKMEPSGVSVIFKQYGENLPGSLSGHEHFGFLDGVSQPGVRGRVSHLAYDVLTPRQNPRDPDDQGIPGQDLLWPGEFVFGYSAQDKDKDVTEAGKLSGTADYRSAPSWARNGSFLVFRRLRQDVGAFHSFLHDQAARLNTDLQFSSINVTPSLLGAKLVGRWQSGAPILRAPKSDDAKLGNCVCANNDFEFFKPDPSVANTTQIPDVIPPITSDDPRCQGPGQFPPSQGDKAGYICPFAGHIRKVYSRDDITPEGTGRAPQDQSDDSEQHAQTHRMLRRGIPFGKASASTPDVPMSDDEDRGLLFLAYQTSIDNQFEFVTKNQVNNPQYRAAGAGFDPIIGQNNMAGQNRKRTFLVNLDDGRSLPQVQDLTTETDWVIPTGGGYFFAPSIDAMENVLSS